MSSKLRDFNLLKVADVSSNSTTTNSVSVVVNSTGNTQSADPHCGFNSNDNQASENVNFTTPTGQTPMPIFPQSTTLNQSEIQNVAYVASTSNQAAQQPIAKTIFNEAP